MTNTVERIACYSHGRYSIGSAATYATWQADMAELVKDFLSGKAVYVEYDSIKHTKRKGSIAKVKKIRNLESLLNNRTYYSTYLRREDDPKYVDPKKATPEHVNADYIDYLDFELSWDGRSNKTRPSGYEVIWLKGYEGPTNWVYETPEVPTVAAKDRLDREIQVGDFICYILHHFGRSYGASTQFGKVTKITKDGNVYAKNIKLGENEESAEKKINDNSTIVILTNDLMDRLMMARLSIL